MRGALDALRTRLRSASRDGAGVAVKYAGTPPGRRARYLEGAGRTVVLGERELAIGFRLIGLTDVVEVTPETAVREFQKAMGTTGSTS